MDETRKQFCDWLEENGAKYPKIDWPSTKTVSGIRGGVAKEAIATDEHMIEIPIKLMLAPPAIFADPEVGDLLKSAEDMLHGDLLLTVFIMHELRKGSTSFYSPFLKILPEPSNISEWSDEHLALLQDHALLLRARVRRSTMKTMYNKTIPALHRMDPVKFPLEEFTYERFKFAWNSVQARAFGRRLPWTALVPFADCLNHSNVQTKYDYNMQGNGMFRLYPTGDNHYAKGAEVFNSYGRRPNENLLMDYGFSMLDNEWDDIELCMTVPREDTNFDLRYNALFLVGYNASRKFILTDCEIPFKAMMFLRIAMMDAAQLAAVVDRIQAPTPVLDPAQAGEAGEGGEGPAADSVVEKEAKAKVVRIANATNPRIEANNWFNRVFSARLELKVLTVLRDLLLTMLGEHATSAAQDMCILDWLNAARCPSASIGTREDGSAENSLGSDVDEERIAATAAATLTDSLDALSLSAGANEKIEQCTAALKKSISPELFDSITALEVESDAYWRLLSATQYRLTRKRIIIGSTRNLDDMIAYFEKVEAVLSGGDDGFAADGCSAFWKRTVVDDHFSAGVDGSHLSGITARRTPSWDYLKRFRSYKWDATNPLQWPEM